MITLRQDPSDDVAFGRFTVDGSIMPTRDTGFRAEPRNYTRYTRIARVALKSPSYEYAHNDEVSLTGDIRLTPRGESFSHIKGQLEPYGGHSCTAYNAVNYVTVNVTKHEDRERDRMLRRILKHREQELSLAS